jgi:thiol-disulfide isomerase/thioredoxin
MSKKLKGLFLFWVLLLLICPLRGAAQEKTSRVHEKLNFTLVTMDDSEVTLSDYRGRAVLVNFWATWCGPCVEETPALVRLYQKYKKRGFVVIGIARQSEESQVNEFINRFSIPYPVGRDTTGEIGSRYKIFSIPTSFLFSLEGKLKRKFEGFGSGVEELIDQELQMLLNSTPARQKNQQLEEVFVDKPEREAQPRMRQRSAATKPVPTSPLQFESTVGDRPKEGTSVPLRPFAKPIPVPQETRMDEKSSDSEEKEEMLPHSESPVANPAAPPPTSSELAAVQKEKPTLSDRDYDFSLTTLDGKHIRLADYRGKVVLVNFWETWCPPCVAETPGLVQLYNKNKDQGFVVIGVIGSSDDAKVKEFIDRFQIPYAIGRESTGVLHRRYQVFGIPALFLFGADGHFIRRIDGGYGAQTEEVLGPEIHALLQPAIKPQETPPSQVATVTKPIPQPSTASEEAGSDREKVKPPSPERGLSSAPSSPQATPQVETIAVEAPASTHTLSYNRWNFFVPLLAGVGLFILTRIRLGSTSPESLGVASSSHTSFGSVPYARLACARALPHILPEIAVVHDNLLIGSGTTCDVILRHPSVARQHARLQWRKQGYILIDLQSPTGTYVNGRRITENLLREGWVVRLGEVEFVFREANVRT